MLYATRLISLLEQLENDLTAIKEDLADDGFEEYADSLQDAVSSLGSILYSLTDTDPMKDVLL